METIINIIICIFLLLAMFFAGYIAGQTNMVNNLCKKNAQYGFCKVEKILYSVEVK